MFGFSDRLQLFVKQALQPLTIKGPQLLGRMRNAEGVIFAITQSLLNYLHTQIASSTLRKQGN